MVVCTHHHALLNCQLNKCIVHKHSTPNNKFSSGFDDVLQLTVSYHDGSPLSHYRLMNSNVEIQPEVITRTGGRRRLETRNLRMIPETPGIWRVTFNLKQELGGEYFHFHFIL